MLVKVQKIDGTWLSGSTPISLGGVPFPVLPQQELPSGAASVSRDSRDNHFSKESSFLKHGF